MSGEYSAYPSLFMSIVEAATLEMWKCKDDDIQSIFQEKIDKFYICGPSPVYKIDTHFNIEPCPSSHVRIFSCIKDALTEINSLKNDKQTYDDIWNKHFALWNLSYFMGRDYTVNFVDEQTKEHIAYSKKTLGDVFGPVKPDPSVRPLKFRAWDIQDKRFTYPDKGYQGHYMLTLNGKFYNLQNGSGGNEYIVQQFTGRQDKDGKDIYEGDIVNCVRLRGLRAPSEQEEFNSKEFIVKWVDCEFRLLLKNSKDFEKGELLSSVVEMKVIGSNLQT